ncbi:hypothetical protein KFE94_05205 [bacterium SCSIO 12643]|nr:hypothetical protein KFE94_05205 [bacterium SCSIO 12643]
MRKRLYLLLSLGIFIGFSVQAQQFDEQTTKVSDVRLNVTNIGTFGNAFRGYRDGSGSQSCEYPAGSGVEHMFESGFWFGGIVNGQVLVSTSAYDAPQGYATGRAGFEFTNVSGPLKIRSSYFDSPFFSPDAVSHEDFVSTFTDSNILIPGTQIPIQGHDNPLNVEVIGHTYNWNYTFSNFFVITNFYIINRSNSTIDSAHFSFWANTVVRNINITPAGSGGAAFYNKGGNGYLDSLYMSYCYDKGGDIGFTQSYVGQKFLGAEDKHGFHHPGLVDDNGNLLNELNIHYNVWQFNNTADPIYFLPQSDNQRYQKMTAGLNHTLCWDQNSSTNGNCSAKSIQEQINDLGNRSDLVSVGPFRDFAPGDTINVTYAFILGPKKDDGQDPSINTLEQKEYFMQNAGWAQTAYNGEDVNFNGELDPGEDVDGNGRITRYILPAPPNSPRTRIDATDNRIDVYWADNSESSVDPITQEMDFEGYRVYTSKLGFDVAQTPPKLEFVKVGENDIPNNGLFYDIGFESIRLEKPVTFEGDTNVYVYKYSIENIQNGWQYAVAVTAFDRGNPGANLESLESSPNFNNFRVFAGKDAVEDLKENGPFAYPNPYYAGAAWEGNSSFQEESRKLIFANLPERCKIRVYTTAGDLLDEIYHDQDYNGTDIRWFQTFGAEDPNKNVFSGGEHAWDLLTQDNQILARGLYIFTVEDLETGKIYKSKFLIIK